MGPLSLFPRGNNKQTEMGQGHQKSGRVFISYYTRVQQLHTCMMHPEIVIRNVYICLYKKPTNVFAIACRTCRLNDTVPRL